MARIGGYRRSAVWRPCGVMPHAALQNKSVVCSGSRVTNSTVMKLRGSVNRGGIIVETYTKSTCSHWYSAVKATKTIPRADGHGLHTVNGEVGGILDRLFFHAARPGWNPGGATPKWKITIKNTQSLRILMASGLRLTYMSKLDMHSVTLKVRDIQVWQASMSPALVSLAGKNKPKQ